MGDFENPLLKFGGTNFSSRLMGAVYQILWAVTLAVMMGALVGAIVWAVMIYGVC